jgi:WNK lysine deficient protein kinase
MSKEDGPSIGESILSTGETPSECPRRHRVHRDRVVEHSPDNRFLRFNRRLSHASNFRETYLGFDNDSGKEICWTSVSVPQMSVAQRCSVATEVETISSLNSPRILGLVDGWADRETGELVLITQRLSEANLRSYVSRLETPLKLKVVRAWGLQVLEGLLYLHTFESHPIIHRDLTCANIYINGDDGKLVIGGLSLCTTLLPDDNTHGTQVDVYAFGLCLLEIITRRSSCEGTTPAEHMQRAGMIANRELRRVVMKCIDQDSTVRPSVTELLQDSFWNECPDGNELVTSQMLTLMIEPYAPVIDLLDDGRLEKPYSASKCVLTRSDCAPILNLIDLNDMDLEGLDSLQRKHSISTIASIHASGVRT